MRTRAITLKKQPIKEKEYQNRLLKSIRTLKNTTRRNKRTWARPNNVRMTPFNYTD
jgi:hypothetical protein